MVKELLIPHAEKRLKGIFLLQKTTFLNIMTKDKNDEQTRNSDFADLLDKDTFQAPKAGDTVTGTVISSSKAEVRLDIDGVMTGIVRGPELYVEVEEYANLKSGDEVEATVIDEENENGELELSFKYAGQEKIWGDLRDAFENKTNIKIKVVAANRGGLVASFGQVNGFLPVSQLSPEKYPRVSGGDRGKILEKLKSYVGDEMEVKVVNLEEAEKEEKIIFSEKDVWNEKQKNVIGKYKVGVVVEGNITAIADFGVFVSFGENLEGLIHISELAWQRIDNPGDLFKVGDKVKAEVISLEGSKIFLSAKKLAKDPWSDVDKKYKSGQTVKGTILKVNPFGLFVELDNVIHGLAHISQLGLAPGQKINDVFKVNDKKEFTVVSVEAKNHRLGLSFGKIKDVDDKKEKELKKTEKKTTKESKLPAGQEEDKKSVNKDNKKDVKETKDKSKDTPKKPKKEEKKKVEVKK